MAEYNESQINSNETERIATEQQRIENEAKRQTNEKEREAREATRQSNESTRISKEAERLAEEVNRVEAEASRVTAEEGRVDAENIRAGFYEGFNDRLNQVDSQLAHIAISIKDFKPFGDGVINDISIFENISNLFNNDATLILEENKTYLLKSEVYKELNISKIKGKNSTLIIDGEVRFKGKFTSIELEGIKIIIKNGKGVKDKATSLDYIFASKTPCSINIRNIDVVGCEEEEKRTPSFLYSQVESGIFENISIKNIGLAFHIIENSKNFTFSNIYGQNIETLIYLKNSENVTVKDCSLINSKHQRTWWIGKDNGVSTNGKDLLLIESDEGDSKNIKISNLYGERCLERVIYGACSYVQCSKIVAVDCQLLKFCGYGKNEKQIIINNIKSIIKDNEYVTVEGNGFRLATYGIEFYNIEDCFVDNIDFIWSFKDEPINVPNNAYCVLLEGYLRNINIKNFKLNGKRDSQSIFAITSYLFDSDVDNILIENVETNNCFIENMTDSCILRLGGNRFSSNCIKNITFKNINILDKKVKYVFNTNDYYMYNILFDNINYSSDVFISNLATVQSTNDTIVSKLNNVVNNDISTLWSAEIQNKNTKKYYMNKGDIEICSNNVSNLNNGKIHIKASASNPSKLINNIKSFKLNVNEFALNSEFILPVNLVGKKYRGTLIANNNYCEFLIYDNEITSIISNNNISLGTPVSGKLCLYTLNDEECIVLYLRQLSSNAQDVILAIEQI